MEKFSELNLIERGLKSEFEVTTRNFVHMGKSVHNDIPSMTFCPAGLSHDPHGIG